MYTQHNLFLWKVFDNLVRLTEKDKYNEDNHHELIQCFNEIIFCQLHWTFRQKFQWKVFALVHSNLIGLFDITTAYMFYLRSSKQCMLGFDHKIYKRAL